jgi:hypothetical protein
MSRDDDSATAVIDVADLRRLVDSHLSAGQPDAAAPAAPAVPPAPDETR